MTTFWYFTYTELFQLSGRIFPNPFIKFSLIEHFYSRSMRKMSVCMYWIAKQKFKFNLLCMCANKPKSTWTRRKEMSRNQSKTDGCSSLFVVSSKICVPFFSLLRVRDFLPWKMANIWCNGIQIYGNMKQRKTAIFVLLRPNHRLRPYFIAALNFIIKRKPHWIVVGLFMGLIKHWVKYFWYSLGMLNGTADWQ